MNDEVRQDFIEAIERIRIGKPTNELLKVKASKGKLKLNNSTVALEASRGLSTLHTAKYRDLKKLISGNRKKTTRNGELADLRIECRVLQKQLELSELRLGHMEISLLQAEQALQKSLETQERLSYDNNRLRRRLADLD